MRLICLAVYALSTFSFVAESAPFNAQDRQVQRSWRRAVRPDAGSRAGTAQDQGSRRLGRRSPDYSVVQVDGSPPSTALPPSNPEPETVVQTVTKQPKTIVETTIVTTAPAVTPPPITETVVLTKVVTESESEKTVLVTTTQKIQPPPRKHEKTIVVTKTVDAGSRSQNTDPATVTVLKTIEITPTPTATTSKKYYDNGMWHTSYVMKTSWGNYDYDWSQTPSSTPTASPSVSPTGGYYYGKYSRVRRAGEPGPANAPVGWNATQH